MPWQEIKGGGAHCGRSKSRLEREAPCANERSSMVCQRCGNHSYYAQDRRASSVEGCRPGLKSVPPGGHPSTGGTEEGIIQDELHRACVVCLITLARGSRKATLGPRTGGTLSSRGGDIPRLLPKFSERRGVLRRDP